ncbi:MULTISPECIES: YbaB/EbfC family nucleoid-associated protein [Saccharopolyspora]|uniref:YbaB/EbfC family nucleoid-associated protein n=1 Tax=Saccharopolyspora TaxID=1835 RepID=UPI001404A88F|nr:YbaB/EbfC family nucleoid-associated protein [Saccharopolyspora elongata]
MESRRVDLEALHRAADSLERQANAIKRARREHARHRFCGRSGSGRVVVTCLGDGTVTKVGIQDGALRGIYPELLAEEIADAIGRARCLASEAAVQAFKKVAPGLAGEQ